MTTEILIKIQVFRLLAYIFITATTWFYRMLRVAHSCFHFML